MNIMNQIMLMMIILSAVGIDAKTASKKHPADKQQIHFYNKYGSDIVVQATWRKRNGLASPGVPKNKEAHPTRITDFTVKKGKSMTVKAPISGYDLQEISAQNAGQVAATVGIAVGAAVVGAVTDGVGAVAIEGAAEGTAVAGAVAIIAGTAGYAEGDVKVHQGKTKADGCTYFTFVPAKGKKVDKKNPPVMIVCATMAPNKKAQQVKQAKKSAKK